MNDLIVLEKGCFRQFKFQDDGGQSYSRSTLFTNDLKSGDESWRKHTFTDICSSRPCSRHSRLWRRASLSTYSPI